MAYFDLFSLNPRCEYLITVSTKHNGYKYVGSFIFSAPTPTEQSKLQNVDNTKVLEFWNKDKCWENFYL
jgi:hypothetical protein